MIRVFLLIIALVILGLSISVLIGCILGFYQSISFTKPAVVILPIAGIIVGLSILGVLSPKKV